MVERIPKDPYIHGPHYFVILAFGGFDVTTPLSSRSSQCRDDYIVDPTVRVVPGHSQIYDPD
jgi:hypothetical protein